jgi:hypothetical protein
MKYQRYSVFEDYLGFDDEEFDVDFFKVQPLSQNFKNFLKSRRE